MLALTQIFPRSDLRLRLVFNAPLAVGAFDASRYAVRSSDAAGADPPVRQAMLVPGLPACVELVLGASLVGGGVYEVECLDVPSGAESVSGVRAFTVARPAAVARAGERSGSGALERELFGADLVFEEDDFALGPDGDLATIAGAENAMSAVVNRFLSEGLSWDDGYGAKPREFVDGARGEITSLRGRLIREAQQDDRVQRAEVTVRPADPNAPDEAEIDVTAVLTGGVTRSARVPMQVS